MATLRWIGNAQPVAQVNTITPANVGIGDTFTATINSKTITVTATATTVANVTALMTTAWNNSTLAEFSEITAVDSTTCITLTHDTKGVPFTQTSSAAGGTATFVTATGTAASGPNFANVGANWDTGSAPTTSDVVHIDNSSVDILYGLAMSAVTLASLNIGKNFTGKIGLPKRNSRGYNEYRADYWAIGTTILKVAGTARRMKIDGGSVQAALDIQLTGTPASDFDTFLWKGTHASNTLEVSGGESSVGIAVHGGEVSTIATILLAAGTLKLGPGCTLTTVTQNFGSLTVNSAMTTFTQNGGTAEIFGTGAVTTVTANGLCYYRSTGTITTANIGGSLNCNRDLSGRTITTCNLNAGGKIEDASRTITYTNKIAIGSTVKSITAA